MNRTRIPIVVLGPDGRLLAGATVAVRNRSSGSSATVYAAETGGSTLSNPLTSDALGRVPGWTDRAAYEATISKSPVLDPYIEAWDSSPASDGAADEPWIDPAITRDAEADVRAPLAVVTSLPSSPVDGQRCVYRPVTSTGDPNYPVLWTLRYNGGSPSGFKWERVGGGWLLAETTAQAQGAGTSYGDLTSSVGPDLTIPLAGDYAYRLACEVVNSGTNGIARMSAAFGAAAAVDADSAIAYMGSPGGASPQRSGRKTGLAAGATVRGKYRNEAGNHAFARRVIELRPLRVG